MTRLVMRAVAAAIVGALAAVVSLTLAFSAHPDLTFEMDRDLPRAASGFYPVERVVRDTFAWTTARAEFVFPRFDRTAAWRCSVSVRGGRPADVPLPMVGLEVDGVELVRRSVTNDYQTIEVGVPARARTPGLRVGIVVSPTFVPAGDPRPLGVQVDRLSCRPAESGLILPPRRAIIAAALAAAALGAAFSLAGVSTTLLAALVLLVAVAQSFPIATGPAPYLDYTGRVITLAVWIGLLAVAIVKGLEWRPFASAQGGRGQPMHDLARFAIAFSAAALYLKLVGLLHPAKPIVDALFHAHRLEWVLAGRYFFTQQMPDGVQFPYAIALYVFSWPWTLLTRDYVTLLRIVVCAAEATAGALLYLMVVRSWGDRAIGALCVVFFHLVPLPYLVLGNANLTNAFGASVSLATMAAAIVWPLGPGQLAQFVGLTMIATVGLLSHVSIFGLLLATLFATAFFYWVLGGPPLRRSARLVLLAGTIAAVVSIASYYAHFGDAYRSLERTGDGAAARATAPAQAGQAAAPATPAAAKPWYRRTLTALDQGVFDVGWPIVILALVGAWRVWVDRLRDRLTCAICAWGAAYAVFLAVSVMAPVDVGYERYAAEFMGRVDLSTYPAALFLAARGAIWMWRSGLIARLGSAALVLWAGTFGWRYWAGWLA
ncbi:MAG TPA: hypothetical protein VES67_13130 [Vicinamibacterales bacterium]|nr:hypothetical protein [Vicinamibacterales bacterium]